MTKYIKVGGILVPVYPEVHEISGTSISRTPSWTLPSRFERFESGTPIGNGLVAYQRNENSCSVLGGRTTLHDNAELVVLHYYNGQTGRDPAFGKKTDYTIVHQEGETTTDLESGTVDLVEGLSPGTNDDRRVEYDFRWIAIPFKWTDESLSDSARVTNYYVYCVYRSRTITISTGAESVSYWEYGTRIILNFAYLNVNRNLFLYIDEEDEPEPFEPSTDSPYPDTPTPQDTSDLIELPGNPSIGVTGAGFINVYNPGLGALQGLGDILFPNVASATDIVDAVIKLCETLANQNLINYVIDCHVIPVTPQTGVSENIKVGFRNTGISVPKVTSDYIDATCGSLNIPEFFHGFQDYQTTRSKIYLPFIGFVDTKPEYWQAGTISVDYKFNVIDGSFMCYIRSVSSKSALNGSVIAQYAGNACMHFPLTGANYSNMVSGLVGAAISAASAGTSTAVLGSALSAANTIAQGGNVQQSNGYNSTAGLLGVRVPFLLIERAVAAYPNNYAHDKGYPSNISTILSGVRGFTTIDDIDLSGIPLTQKELEELRGLLKEGVYF